MTALLLVAMLVPTQAHAKEEMERASTKKALVPGSAEAVEEAVKLFEKAVGLADQGRIARAISVLEQAVGLPRPRPDPGGSWASSTFRSPTAARLSAT